MKNLFFAGWIMLALMAFPIFLKLYGKWLEFLFANF